jgi:hypothetical protein
MDRRNFDRATFASNYHRCPKCNTRGTYHKEDYLLRNEQTERPAAPPGETQP